MNLNSFIRHQAAERGVPSNRTILGNPFSFLLFQFFPPPLVRPNIPNPSSHNRFSVLLPSLSFRPPLPAFLSVVSFQSSFCLSFSNFPHSPFPNFPSKARSNLSFQSFPLPIFTVLSPPIVSPPRGASCFPRRVSIQLFLTPTSILLSIPSRAGVFPPVKDSVSFSLFRFPLSSALRFYPCRASSSSNRSFHGGFPKLDSNAAFQHVFQTSVLNMFPKLIPKLNGSSSEDSPGCASQKFPPKLQIPSCFHRIQRSKVEALLMFRRFPHPIYRRKVRFG